MAQGVRRCSRLLPHQVVPAPVSLTIVPRRGLASTLVQGRGGSSRVPSARGRSRITYSSPAGVNPPRPLKKRRSSGSAVPGPAPAPAGSAPGVPAAVSGSGTVSGAAFSASRTKGASPPASRRSTASSSSPTRPGSRGQSSGIRIEAPGPVTAGWPESTAAARGSASSRYPGGASGPVRWASALPPPLSMARAMAFPRRRSARRAAASSRSAAVPRIQSTRNSAPGSRTASTRRARAGSSTFPAVPESGPAATRARGAPGLRPRPRNRARSVSWPSGASPPRSPPRERASRAWTRRGCASPSARGRRRTRSARRAGSYSVWRKSLENTGWAAWAAKGFSTGSTKVVASSRRGRPERFRRMSRRTSAFASPGTATWSRLSTSPCRRARAAPSPVRRKVTGSAGAGTGAAPADQKSPVSRSRR